MTLRGAAALLAGALAAGALGPGVRVARAETKEEAQARTLFLDGNKRLDQGEYVAALELYREAYQLFPSPVILVNMGTALNSLGRYAEAADVWERYLANPPKNAKPETIQRVQKLFEGLEKKLARLEIDVEEPGARVLLDGKEIGRSPQKITLRVEPGPHMVAAEKDGFTPTFSSVTVAAGDVRAVQLKLLEKGEPQETGTSTAVPTEVASADPAPDGATDAAVGDDPEPTGIRATSRGLSHGGRIGGLARVDIDGNEIGRGAVLTVGATYGIGDRVEIAAAGIVGSSPGAYLGASLFFATGAWKPMVTLGAPLYFVDGSAIPGAYAAAGIQWDPAPSFGLLVSAGVQHYFSDAVLDTTVFTPSIGLQVRL